MRSITAAFNHGCDDAADLAGQLAASEAVEEILILDRPGDLDSAAARAAARGKGRAVLCDSISGGGVARLLDETRTEYLLIVISPGRIQVGQRAVERFLSAAEETGAGLVYSDFKDEVDGLAADHPLIDYQAGSIRDTFDFGSIVLLSRSAAQSALRSGRISEGLRWGGFYDLRLKLSTTSSILRIPEPLYTRIPSDRRASGERQFDYVDPRQRDYQIEMEEVATAHLERTGSYLAPEFEPRPRAGEGFPLRASVIIPVRNRERTIKEAVVSALSQKTPFDFNVIVVDNHSTDRTTEILTEISGRDPRVVHIRPERTDLGIGGCWNQAIYSERCGEYAVQLDSDDLYANDQVLERMVAELDCGYAMVIGSYTIVNFDLEELPPGLIDHREWTRENGRNNALRINGLGAPRAFYVPVVRRIGFPNASYGEDYAVALRISRRFEIGRIFDSIYFARRWEGNSDAALPIATANRYDAYKDWLRTVEIMARKRMNER